MNKNFLPLRTILKHGRSDQYPVAETADRTFTWSDLTRDIDAIVRTLSESDGDRWILYSSDCYKFLTGLFALLVTESTAILPPKAKEGILKQCAEDADGALTDTSVDSVPDLNTSAHLRIDEHVGSGDPPSRIDFPYLDPDRPCIELFTSGTTGENSLVSKSISHLEQDTDAEERLWGEDVEDAIFLGTVSTQHIYGMLMRCLWPLSSGQPIHPDLLLYPDDVRDAVESSSRDVVLVTSPPHLKSFVRAEIFQELKDQIQSIFSGGGVIPEEVSEKAHDQLGFYPIDVFGTTETGGIGWRPSNESSWRTFNNVETKLDEDNRLHVKSPAVSMTDDWYATGDLAEEQDGSFVLREREDRVVNITGTRISLEALEKRLRQEDTVDNAVTLCLDTDHSSSDRKTIGAVIQLTSDGADRLNDSEEALRTELRDVLSDHFPSVALPKQWVFVDDIPEDQLGKSKMDELQARFDAS